MSKAEKVTKQEAKKESITGSIKPSSDLPPVPSHLLSGYEDVTKRIKEEIEMTGSHGWNSLVLWIEEKRKEHALQAINPDVTTKMPELITHQMYIKAFDDIIMRSRNAVSEYQSFRHQIESGHTLYSNYADFKFMDVEWDFKNKKVIVK